MKKLIVFTILLMLPSLFSFAKKTDDPTKSVTSRIRVIIPPFAIIRLADNSIKAVPFTSETDHKKQLRKTQFLYENDRDQSGPVELSNQDIITNIESKTEKSSDSLQTTNTYTSTQE